jgi:hypothetical protein
MQAKSFVVATRATSDPHTTQSASRYLDRPAVQSTLGASQSQPIVIDDSDDEDGVVIKRRCPQPEG